ncbi:MAG: symmetrical bis(5'-nucleosyl)-tetraphosphatase, partial [Thioalkalispiraceae bacterium]
KISFDPGQDQLWFVGDLVNRGPQSLETLRFVKSLADNAISVLGNHDLHLLAVAHGVKSTRSHDLQRILEAHDRDELLEWLSHRPLLHHDPQQGYTLVHAGIYPWWSLQQAQSRAHELEQVLRNSLADFLQHMYGDQPDTWDEKLVGYDRLRFICNSFTRMRFVDPQGRLDHENKMSPSDSENATRPWFEFDRIPDTKIIFGHWSTLPLITGPDVYAIDTGCVWGGSLSAYCLQTRQVTQVGCAQHRNPYQKQPNINHFK